MGRTVRDKHNRTNRKARPVKQPNSGNEPGPKQLNCNPGVQESAQIVNPNDNRNPNLNQNDRRFNFDDYDWGYCTEEQLEEILLKNLGCLFNEAISKLVASGYDEGVALKAILRNGHCYGGKDVLTNIWNNALAYLNPGSCEDDGNSEGFALAFTDLRQLEEYSLADMVCLLQQVRPQLSRGDAMWSLLMSDLNVARAIAIETPVISSSRIGCSDIMSNVDSVDSSVGSSGVGVAPGLCKFHEGWGSGSGANPERVDNEFGGFVSYGSDMPLPREIEYAKRLDLSPSVKSLLKRNIAAFIRSKCRPVQFQSCSSSVSSDDASRIKVPAAGMPVEKCEELHDSTNQDAVNSVLEKFCDLNLDENLEDTAEDQKDKIILTLLCQVKDLEKQVKERKEWAQQKAMQAARKLSTDLTELKMLRMEREETQSLKKGKQTLEDPTMKRLSEMENALRKASSQVDRATVAVRRLENENAEIRAEMEASKLSASESVTTSLEVAKREKKCLKRLRAWEKQKTKLQEEIAAEKRKFSELQQQLVQIHAAQKETEAKWLEELKAKELAVAQVQEERRSKEATESNNKKKLETLRLKMGLDVQRHKDDLQRLEQDLSRLKVSALSTNPHDPSDRACGETDTGFLCVLDERENSSEKETESDRKCLVCKKAEVSVVFLPCAHQVMCVNCSDKYGKKGKDTCPCCRVQIERRVRVFGVST